MYVYVNIFLILQAHNKQDFPGWTTIVTCISHFMLVINSSTNMILYIFLNAAFRKHFMELVGVIGKWICCFRNKERASVSSKRNVDFLRDEARTNGFLLRFLQFFQFAEHFRRQH